MKATQDLSASLAKVIQKHRLAKKISMLRVAEAAGLDKTVPGKIEAGKRVPSIDTADRIAKALGVPLWKLIKEAEACPTLRK